MVDERVIGVTGAKGFVGTAVVRSLVADAVRVRLFGREAGEAEGLPVEALRPSVESFAGLDSLVHLAGVTGRRMPLQTLAEVNVALAADTLTAAIKAGVRRFVFFSSIGVHGRGSQRPVAPEDHFAPVNAYGRSKVNAERVLNYINRDGAIELIVVRPPMIYGPGGRSSLDALVRAVRLGAPLPFGAATAKRSFCSLGNVVSATRAALTSTASAGVLLPSDPDDFSTCELIETIKAACDLTVPLVRAPPEMMKLLLAVLGQRELAASLFDPLSIDRAHWRDWGWTPPEVGREAVAQLYRSK